MRNIAEEITRTQDKDGMLRRALERIIRLYTDRSHFLYELLQNAEDAEATKIKFVQLDDRLEVYHDGKPFSVDNLKGLCDIGMSDKAKDYNQIGEFGVGFKSVFSICETVELYSEPENYGGDAPDAAPAFAVRIDNFTEVTGIERCAMDGSYTTKFVFPYAVGHEFSGFEKEQDLKDKVSEKLQNLGITTLLFMKHLELIAYEINFTSSPLITGEYLLDKRKISDYCLLVSALGSSQNKGEEDISYLKYSYPLENVSTRTVDIAFPVIKKGENFECKKSDSPYISVYFPTETESKLDFIVQGPYRTTPNRSSIPFDDSDNIILAEKTATLLIVALEELRQKGWLNMSFIKVLPLSEEPFEKHNLFYPVYEAVLKMFSDRLNPTIPCQNGGYVSAEYAKIARPGNLIELFDDKLLTELIREGTEYRWLPACLTETSEEYSYVYKYFVNKLKIEVVRPETLRHYLEANPGFLPKRPGSWLVQFYGMLNTVRSLFDRSSREPNYLTAKIIKTTNGDFVAPCRRTEDNQFVDNVYLPSEQVNDPDIIFVDKEIYMRAQHFFEGTLGLHAPDEYRFFVTNVKKRYSNNYTFEEVRHIDDVKRLHKYLNNPDHKEEIEIIIKEIFLVRCTDGIMRKTDGRNVFLPKNGDIDLKGYLENISHNVHFVDLEFYSGHGVDVSVLIELGVIGSLLLNEDMKEGKDDKSGKWSCARYSPDFRWKLDIIHLKDVVGYIAAHPSAEDSHTKSKTIFSILRDNEPKLRGTVHIKNTERWEDKVCELVTYLRGDSDSIRLLPGWDGRWLYDTSDQLVAPWEITREGLNIKRYGEAQQDSIVYDLLRFKKSSSDMVKELEKKVTPEQLNAYFEVEVRRRYRLSPEELGKRVDAGRQEEIDGEKSISEFPSARVKNWAALKRHVAEVFAFAGPAKYEYVVRHIRTSKKEEAARVYLRDFYMMYEGSTVCQMCRKHDSQFEACQIFSQMEKELYPCYLNLCPTCASKYRGIRNDPSVMNKFKCKISDLSTDKIEESDPVRLEVMDNVEIWFTQIHMAEIKELCELQEMQQRRGERS